MGFCLPVRAASLAEGDRSRGEAEGADLEKGLSGAEKLGAKVPGERRGGHRPHRLVGARPGQAVRGPARPGPPCTAARWRLGGPSLAVNLV